MNNPFVSIIVPCYNQAQYLDEALESVLKQIYIYWECIIVNDGSPDNTEEIAQKWVKKDARFHYFKKENGGLSSARNFGIEKSVGEYILPLDADDKIGEKYVHLAIKEFQDDATLKVVYCKAEKFGDETGIWELPNYSLKNLTKSNMIFCSAIYRKEDWKKVFGYDINMFYGLEDWEFWIAILKNGGVVKCLDEIGFFYRIKSKSMVKKINHEQNKYSIEYLNCKHADFFISEYGTFTGFMSKLETQKNTFDTLLKSRKFVINLFCKTFFGFSLFKRYR